MLKFIRATNRYIQHLLVCKSEEIGDGNDRLHDDSPYSSGNGEFKRFLLHFPEQSSNGFIVVEPFGEGEYVVLQCHDGCVGYLLREVFRLALSHPEQSLTLLEDHLQRPPLGVNPVGLEEFEFGVRSDEPAPCAILGAPYEEHPTVDTGECDFRRDVPASKFPAVFLHPFLVEMPDEGGCGEVLPSEAVHGLPFLSDLDASELMAFDVTGVYKADYLFAGEPAVRKQVLEAYALPYGGLDHFNCKRYLVLAILGKAFANSIFLVALGGVSGIKLFLGHAVVALAAFLSYEGKVKQHLGHAVRDAKEESLEAEDALVLEVGMDTAYAFHPLPCLGKVGVVNHKAGRPFLVVGAGFYAIPELNIDIVHEFAPVDIDVAKKTVKHVLLATHKAA